MTPTLPSALGSPSPRGTRQLARRQRLGHHGHDAVAAKSEVAEDAIGLLPRGRQAIPVGVRQHRELGSGGVRRREEYKAKNKADAAWHEWIL